MGIAGLLPLLKSITNRITLSQLSGCTLAVDAYSWLHKGAYGCAVELLSDHHQLRAPNSLIEYCLFRVRVLISHNIKPILVFDGDHHPLKAGTEKLRQENRKRAREVYREAQLRNDFVAINKAAQRSIEISPHIAKSLIDALKKEGVPYIVAPYEADAQMAWLNKHGVVSGIISEDSDLLLFSGVTRIFTKFDASLGTLEEIQLSNLFKLSELDMQRFTHKMFVQMAILSGCDYLPGLAGFGLKTAHKYMSMYRSIDKVLDALESTPKYKIPQDYRINFQKAEHAFEYATIYNYLQNQADSLNPLTDEILNSDFQAWLGKKLPDNIAKGVADGDLHPSTHLPFKNNNNCPKVATNANSASILNRVTLARFTMPLIPYSRGRKLINCSLAKNIPTIPSQTLLTSYFSN